MAEAAGTVDEVVEADRRKTEVAAGSAGPAPDIRHCPVCGAAAIPGKNFCADCGRRL